MEQKSEEIQNALEYLEGYSDQEKYKQHLNFLVDYISELEEFKTKSETNQNNKEEKVEDIETNNECVEEDDAWEFTFIKVPGGDKTN